MTLRDMKISTLLTVGFGMLVLFIMFLGGVAQLKVNTMQRLFGQVIEERIPQTATANQIKEGLSGIAIALRNMILISDTEKVQKEAQKIEALRQRIDGLVQQLNTRITHDAGKAILGRVVAARQVFDPLQAEVTDMALSGQVFEAKALLIEKLTPAQDAYFAALDQLLLDQTQLLTESTDSTQQETQSVKWVVSATVVSALIVGLFIGWWTVRAIARPIHQAVALSQAVAAGDLSQPLDATQRNELGQLIAALQSMQTGLVQVVTQVRESSDSVSTASAEIARGNTDLSNRTEDQASALQETSSAMAELRDAVEHNATSAKEASALALKASQIADRGGKAVSNVVGTMHDIRASSQKIASITGVIDSIAFQTNILALNAAVEAARAGEQGRGFAVVASEVRLLASRSAEAAREIKALIQASGDNITQGAAFAEDAGKTMVDVVGSIQQVAEVMQNISAANLAQSQGVVQICDAVSQMDQMTQQNAALVEQMAAAASSLQSQAQDLVGTVSVFKLSTGTLRLSAA